MRYRYMLLKSASSLVAVYLYFVSIQCVAAFTLANPTGFPVGGGKGYENVVDRSSSVVVSNKNEFLDAIENASYGDIIYIEDSATVDLTNEWGINVPGGVTIASGRGRNGSLGALVYTDSMPPVTDGRQWVFHIKGSGVRFTGLRLRGPSIFSDRYMNSEDCEVNEAGGIFVNAPSSSNWDVEVDNNEMWGWPDSPVRLSNVHNGYVHHNYIHHNRRHERSSSCGSRGLGYGVVTNLGNAVIEANLFSHNRHDIASTGKPGSSYEARYNLILEGLIGHSFDMHGCHDRPSDPACDGHLDAAGETIYIHSNTFLHENHSAVVIRGTPEDRADINDNKFTHNTLFCNSDYSGQLGAICQRNTTGNLYADGNSVGRSSVAAWFVSQGASELSQLRAFSSFNPAAMKVGDFDGDGSKDLLWANGSKWIFSSSARSAWEDLRPATESLDEIRVGDFNGDGVSDVFTSNGREWFISWGAKSEWQKVANSTAPLSSLRFSDFNGDGKTDVFRTNGSEWYISWAAQSPWEKVINSSAPLSELRFADFDGDGSEDVFWGTDDKWLISRSADNSWIQLNGFHTPVSDLKFCDFNGDGKEDVLRVGNNEWLVSYSGQGSWQKINGSIKDRNSISERYKHELNYLLYNLNDLALGDFNGDGKCDVLMKREL